MQKIIPTQTLIQEFACQITPLHQCSYLPDRAARLEFIEPNHMDTPTFSRFSRQGFRRSGQQLYRPFCLHCQRCIATRLPVTEFSPNRTQRKILQKNSQLAISIIACVDANEQHFALYARYICERHSDGDMYPPSPYSFERFLAYSFTHSFFMEFWDEKDDTLVMVAVCDKLDDGISAVYTFFEPSFDKQSLGVYAILSQIEYVKGLGLPYLYLGFWIPHATKMQYKANYHPIELYIDEKWHYFADKITPERVEPLLQQAIKHRYLNFWANDNG